MRNKKVYTSVSSTKDSSGRIIESMEHSVVVNKSQETFIMITTTNGLSWIESVRNHLAFLVYLSSYADKNGIVSLTPLRKDEIQLFFKWKNRVQVDNALGVLLKHDCIKRIGRGDYMINPDTVFTGGTITKSEKSNLYQSML